MPFSTTTYNVDGNALILADVIISNPPGASMESHFHDVTVPIYVSRPARHEYRGSKPYEDLENLHSDITFVGYVALSSGKLS
ncbi:hypothetical protein EKO27_g2175 [Xylaria grammica]|uniref:Uncharacterized protein n=1 Tax=Xylaria grammica TaxID=363999 RepID=A0A439DEW6_9PEZI|nr:hypothetical protein EKO27_g2175 [Xylaria grammica]